MTNVVQIPLREIAWARSGDKGNHANIGVIAKNAAAYQWMCAVLTVEAVHDFFRELGVTRVQRFELPNVQALNFVLYNALAGGASESLRMDTQGKLLGTAILDLKLPVDAAKLSFVRAEPDTRHPSADTR